jgi:hypothetical protein
MVFIDKISGSVFHVRWKDLFTLGRGVSLRGESPLYAAGHDDLAIPYSSRQGHLIEGRAEKPQLAQMINVFLL